MQKGSKPAKKSATKSAAGKNSGAASAVEFKPESMVGIDAAKFLATWTNAHEKKLTVEQRDTLAAAMMVLRSVK